MPSSTSSIGRLPSYSLYSSYRSPSASSYLGRTTSLDRSSYGGSSGISSSSSNNYYRYSGLSKGLPPRPTYSSTSSSSDTYRNSNSSRSVRASPVRSSYSSRLASDSNIDRDTRYSTLTRTRESSTSRDSGYGSHYTSCDRSVDCTNGNARSSYARRESDYDNNDISTRVTDRIRAYESRRDPVEERLAMRRRRLGLSPARDVTSVTARSPKPLRRYGLREDNRRTQSEENGNDTIDDRRSSVNDLCRKFNGNLNLTNGTESPPLSDLSNGSATTPMSMLKAPSANGSRPQSPSALSNVRRQRLDSGKDDSDSAASTSSCKSASRSPRPKTPNMSEASALTNGIDKQTSNGLSSSNGVLVESAVPQRSKERRERMKERIAQRLSYEMEDGDSPPSRRRSPTGGSSSSLQSDTRGLVGLRNIGNTCFLNSITQCLSNTRCLLEYMLRENYVTDINTSLSTMKGDLVKAFGNLLTEMWREGSPGPVNTGPYKSQIQRFAPTFIGYAQHDAQEFLRKLLEGLHDDVNRVTTRPRPIHEDIDEEMDDNQKAMESWKRYLRFDDSKIVDMFVGQLKSSLLCSVCGHRSVTFDPFWDLSLPIPSRAGQVKLGQCLDLFTKEEVMEGEESPTCSKCKERRKMTKSFSIQKFPKVLVLHLKRFSPNERWRGKLTCMVDFALDSLDLSRYAASASISSQYKLISVANHSGTALSGHYTAYCRHPYLKSWYEYNDSRVSSISSNRVCSPEAYVLFYELNSY